MGVRAIVHQVVRRPVDPARIAIGEQPADLPPLQREHPAEIPTRQSEDSWLQGVEHGQQQVGLLDLVDLLGSER